MPGEEPKYLRSKTDGHLFPYNEHLVGHPDLEPLTEAEAYPERHVPEHVEKKKGKAEAGLDIAEGIAADTGKEKDAPTDPALAKQAAKGWPK